MARTTGKSLAKAAGLEFQHALYRKSGDWYHLLESFPGALMDENGYIEFKTETDYKIFLRDGVEVGVHENRDTNILTVKGGISRHHGYKFFSEDVNHPEEIVPHISVFEGAKTRVMVNRYERDPIARSRCIQKWGTMCVVCSFSFSRTYGKIGEGFIHVHHLIPLSSIRAEYEMVPERDLRPVCPNCHAMLHRREPSYSIEELRRVLES